MKKLTKTAHVSWALNFNEINLKTLEKLCFKICPERLELACKLNEHSKKLNIAAFLLAAFCIKKQFKINKLEFFKINGKPFLKNQNNAFFNISHSKNAVACATATVPIGIDLEKIRPLNLKIANKICSKIELCSLLKLPKAEQTPFLFKIWTAKESFAKMKAETIFKNLTSLNHKNIRNIKHINFENYFLSVCSKSAKKFKFEKINFAEILSFLEKN